MAAVSVDAEQFTAEVFAEAERHAARTPQRRAACHLWSALITSPTVDAARKAIATFGEPETQADAGQLLGRLLKEHACQP